MRSFKEDDSLGPKLYGARICANFSDVNGRGEVWLEQKSTVDFNLDFYYFK